MPDEIDEEVKKEDVGTEQGDVGKKEDPTVKEKGDVGTEKGDVGKKEAPTVKKRKRTRSDTRKTKPRGGPKEDQKESGGGQN